MTSANMPPFLPYGAILTIVRVTGTIAIAQPLLNFFNNDPTKNVYLVIIYTRKHGILANQKSLTCIVVMQRCLFPYS
jgi:hypothetical protein